MNTIFHQIRNFSKMLKVTLSLVKNVFFLLSFHHQRPHGMEVNDAFLFENSEIIEKETHRLNDKE